MRMDVEQFNRKLTLRVYRGGRRVRQGRTFFTPWCAKGEVPADVTSTLGGDHVSRIVITSVCSGLRLDRRSW